MGVSETFTKAERKKWQQPSPKKKKNKIGGARKNKREEGPIEKKKSLRPFKKQRKNYQKGIAPTKNKKKDSKTASNRFGGKALNKNKDWKYISKKKEILGEVCWCLALAKREKKKKNRGRDYIFGLSP